MIPQKGNVLKDQLQSYLEGKGIDIHKPFHCLNPEHDDHNPSMSYDPKRNRIKCFSCGVDYDTFGLIKAEYGIIDDKDVYAKANELFPTAQNQHKTSPEIPSQNAVKTRSNKPHHAYLEQCAKDVQLTDYFAKRGIGKHTADLFRLGYDKKTGFAVIPTSDGAYVSRNVDPNCKQGDRYRKSSGEAHVFNHACISSDRPIFVVEGEFDALSMAEAGQEAIALGSATNKGKLFSLLEKQRPKHPLILALDQDDAGIKASAEILIELEAKGIKAIDPKIYGEYKDANEFLMADRNGFIEAVKTALKAAESLAGAEREAYEKNSAKSHILAFLDGIAESANTSAITTWFKELDAALGGGLYEGLYVIGALSSLGKTTFTLQIADQIAQQGYDVLFISLEMARTELMAKSISRLTYMFDEAHAKTARGITDGKRYFADEDGYGGYSDEEKQHIKNCVMEYEKYAQHLYFMEGIGTISANDVRQMVEKHKRITGKAPVVMVDYLQLLAPNNPRATDKQTADQSVMILKQISRDYKVPVIAISSLNRNSYKDPIEMKSFKESGGIEYSSDVLIGLQPTGIGESDFDVDEYKRRDPRGVDVVILKNRNGSTGEKVTFEYKPAYNHFEE